MTKTEQLAMILEQGKTMSAQDIKSMIGLKNPQEAIASLRRKGYCVYSNPNGYRLGQPTKQMIAYLNSVIDPSNFRRTK